MRLICLLGISICLLLASCDNYNKVVRSTDVEFKLTKAKDYYNTGDYFKAKDLFAQLLEIFRNDPRLEEIYFYYAYCFYGNDEYQQASFQFKNYVNYFPNSNRADECQYMYAKSMEALSPKVALDQSFTVKTIEAYNLYLKKFPTGKYRDEVISTIDALQLKLETKALDAALLYYRTENFKSAVVAFTSLLETFPNSSISEQATYYAALCQFRYAQKSIETVQKKRYEEAKALLKTYFKEFQTGQYKSKAQDLDKDLDKVLEIRESKSTAQ